MDKTKLKRHTLAFVTATGKQQLFLKIKEQSNSTIAVMAKEIFCAGCDIPGIIRRDDIADSTEIALGFVHYKRIDGNRIRFSVYTQPKYIETLVTPYEVMRRCIYGRNSKTVRTACLEVAAQVYEAALELDLEIGILGSACLELITGLPYTDEFSDLDVLVQPAAYEKLQQFYSNARSCSNGINMDFEVDFPNGYGVKLEELFMDTQTVLGKSIKNVALLSKMDMLKYLQ